LLIFYFIWQGIEEAERSEGERQKQKVITLWFYLFIYVVILSFSPINIDLTGARTAKDKGEGGEEKEVGRLQFNSKPIEANMHM